jgi:hypothetical protein
MAAEFDALLRVAPENPVNPTVFATPSIASSLRVASATTLSVSEMAAPAGSSIETMK